MRITGLVLVVAISINVSRAKFGSASPRHASNPPPPLNVSSFGHGGQPHVDREDEIDSPNKDAVRPAAHERVAAYEERPAEALMTAIPKELNDPKKNADRRADATGRKMQSSTWTQLGLDIDGDTAYDYFGAAVSLSSGGSVLAVGAPGKNLSGRIDAGRVRVYKFNGTLWTQFGVDIDGEATYGNFGRSVSLSSDGTVLAVGARNNGGGSTDVGHVRVYRFDGIGWTQLGLDIDGELANDDSGSSVFLSGGGNVLAVGAPGNNPSGHVRVYKFNGTGWTQLGLDIDGEGFGDQSGSSVSLSSDGSVLAVGAPYNDPSSDRTNAGHVRVFNFNGTGWTQLGVDIDGEAAGGRSGHSVSLSSDGTVLAVGAPFNNGNGLLSAGHVRVFKFNGTGWTQLGVDIDGEMANENSGRAVSLSSDGSMLAVGGHVRVFKFNGTGWTRLHDSLDNSLDNSGRSVSLSSDGSMLAVGAPYNDPNGRTDAGRVQVYENEFHSPSSRLENFRGASIKSTCIVNTNMFLLECSASMNASIAGGFKTSLVQGTCMAGNPPTQESPVSSIALDVNVDCKSSGTCNHTHCFRADFVVEGLSVLAAMIQVVSVIIFEKDGSFSVDVGILDFATTSETIDTKVATTVTATLGECGSTSNIEEALHIGDTAVVCISSPDNVQLSLKSVTANPGNQVLVNGIGEPNFLTTLNDNGKSVMLQTLIIPVYFDALGGSAGSIVIEGTAEISYSARRLVGSSYLGEVEEALFGLEVPLIRYVDDPEIAQIIAKKRNFGSILGWDKIIPLLMVWAVFVML
ncbi:hypothetical protein ACHAW6_014891 [Cyclotella cf. meneghiniana]